MRAKRQPTNQTSVAAEVSFSDFSDRPLRVDAARENMRIIFEPVRPSAKALQRREELGVVVDRLAVSYR